MRNRARSGSADAALCLGLSVVFACADHSAGAGPPTPVPGVDAAAAPGGALGGMPATPGMAGAVTGSMAGGTPLGPIQRDRCGDVDQIGLDKSAILALTGGGPPGSLRYLYPYDGTVFPRGLAAPVLMWDDGGQPVDAVHLYVHSSTHGFRGCFRPEAPGRLTLPQAAWDTLAAQTRGKADPYQVELTILRGGSVQGPIRESLIIAPGSLKGSVFYNSYSSGLGKKTGAPGGVILRIPAGGTAEVFLGRRACAGCHGASADGRRLVTNEAVYALAPGIGVEPAPLRSAVASFPGVSPDGSVYSLGGQFIETDTGNTLLNTGLPALANQLAFSPDGRWLTFVDGIAAAIPIPGLTTLIPGLIPQGSGLVMMRYDAATRSASEPKSFANAPAGATWPNLLPDDKAIVLADAATNDLMLVDVASGSVTLLARAMGFATVEDAKANKTFLPYGTAEVRFAYFPTVAPISAGGYFWAYFDSPRRYGNMDTTKIESGLAVPAGINVGAALPGLPGLPGTASKQLWVTAIEIAPDGNYRVDRSAPAFYLPGQELGTNNHRAFSALDPCREVGAGCQSGTDCCSGFCGGSACEPPPPRCSKTEEACKAEADCCIAGEQCINGFCSTIVLL